MAASATIGTAFVGGIGMQIPAQTTLTANAAKAISTSGGQQIDSVLIQNNTSVPVYLTPGAVSLGQGGIAIDAMPVGANMGPIVAINLPFGVTQVQLWSSLASVVNGTTAGGIVLIVCTKN